MNFDKKSKLGAGGGGGGTKGEGWGRGGCQQRSKLVFPIYNHIKNWEFLVPVVH